MTLPFELRAAVFAGGGNLEAGLKPELGGNADEFAETSFNLDHCGCLLASSCGRNRNWRKSLRAFPIADISYGGLSVKLQSQLASPDWRIQKGLAITLCRVDRRSRLLSHSFGGFQYSGSRNSFF